MDRVKLPASMGLYRDVMSLNTARGGEGRSIGLGLEQEGKPEAKTERETSTEDDQKSLEVEEYEKRLEQAIKIFESAPKHFLQ
ncbi:uncharacterized protein N7498_010461 [Penicillium cinerascens]|uniref:Uncharacterized protein n=1 Tax=Penicillium cinerascens TaxID=70096 RepID=A0A9W9JBW8_9EURO|nr:uncharacterized protein N7498_010461 [Penicillium cinerascens]KAJ5191476.1 hypothetical protein N7498_010461 [Penicillium cinerascens]